MMKAKAALVALLIITSSTAAFALPFPRQVDPATAPPEIPYGPGLLLYYGQVLNFTSSQNFSATGPLLAQMGLMNMPPAARQVIQRFNALVSSTSDLLSRVKTDMDNASAMVKTGRLDGAKPYLVDALSLLFQANQTIQELRTASSRVVELTGIPSAPFAQKISDLYTLESTYAHEVNSVISVITASGRLEPTAVNITASPPALPVGSSIDISGSLTTGAGGGLAGKNVTVFFAGGELANATTDGAGGFSVALNLPYLYQRNASLFASYLPAGNDSLVYAPSSSRQVLLSLLYHVPEATVSLPAAAYPGIPFTVNGTLRAGGAPLAGYSLTAGISGEDQSAVTDQAGMFSLTMEVPANASTGTATILFSAPADGPVAPLSNSSTLDVVRLLPLVTVGALPLSVVGIGATVDGEASVNGTPLQGARVFVTGAGVNASTVTDAGGRFSLDVVPPLTTPSGALSLAVAVYPQQGWAASARTEAGLPVVNPATLLLPALGALLLGFAVTRRRRRAEEVAPPAVSPAERPDSVYMEAVGVAERATGVRLRPHHTIREYLRLVKEGLRGFESFQRISFIQEALLYGPGNEDVKAAQDELRRLREANEAQ